MSPEIVVAISLFLISFIAGSLVLWGKTKKTIEIHGDTLARIEKADYITRREHDDDMKLLCKKVEEIKSLVRDMDRNRENARETQHKELTKITLFMGKVDQFMKDASKQPRA